MEIAEIVKTISKLEGVNVGENCCICTRVFADFSLSRFLLLNQCWSLNDPKIVHVSFKVGC